MGLLLHKWCQLPGERIIADRIEASPNILLGSGYDLKRTIVADENSPAQKRTKVWGEKGTPILSRERPRPVHVHLILANPWSKEWGQRHPPPPPLM